MYHVVPFVLQRISIAQKLQLNKQDLGIERKKNTLEDLNKKDEVQKKKTQIACRTRKISKGYQRFLTTKSCASVENLMEDDIVREVVPLGLKPMNGLYVHIAPSAGIHNFWLICGLRKRYDSPRKKLF